MPWELMGVHMFFDEFAQYLVLHRLLKQNVVQNKYELLP